LQKRTLHGIAWGAGGALVLAALVAWLSERAAQPLASVAGVAPPAAALQSASPTSSAPPASTPPPIAPATVAPSRAPLTAPASGADEEAALMAELRSLKSANPARAMELARAGNQRFPDSADAPERASILIHALSDLGRGSEARGEAEHMVNYYPDSSWVREIERFTGAHRHRNVRLNAEGQLEYY
jgi:hypothetical protein